MVQLARVILNALKKYILQCGPRKNCLSIVAIVCMYIEPKLYSVTFDSSIFFLTSAISSLSAAKRRIF